jgi:hypothetical protein
MDTFQNLSPNDSLQWESRVEEHDLNLDATTLHFTFNPRNKVSIQLFQEQDLNVRNISRVATGNLEVCILDCLAPSRTKTSLTISPIIPMTIRESTSMPVTAGIRISALRIVFITTAVVSSRRCRRSH